MNERSGMFEGVGVALITPFRRGAVDREALAALAERLVERGVSALYPCGCTGEATSLTREERATVIRPGASESPVEKWTDTGPPSGTPCASRTEPRSTTW